MKRAKDPTFIDDLVVLGFLSAETADRLRHRRRDLTPRVGQLALHLRMLTVAQVFEVLAAQSERTDGARFGETAIELGFMTAEDLVILLAQQRRSVPDWRELIADEGVLDKQQLSEALSQLSALERKSARLKVPKKVEVGP